MINRLRPFASLQDALGNIVVGEGYVLRDDNVAVALLELTPPDLRLYDADSLARLLEAYTNVLRICPDRCSLLTFAVPLDIQPLIRTLAQAQHNAADVRSYIILGALSDWMNLTWSALLHLRSVRWLVAVPSVAPETPPSGTWGELLPTAIVGQTTRLAGDPVAEALTRAHRLLGQFALLGIEPAPRLLPASSIRSLLRSAFDPVGWEGDQRHTIDLARPFQVAAPEG